MHGFHGLNCTIWLLNPSERFAKPAVPMFTAAFPTSVLLYLYIFPKQLSLRGQANMMDRKARSLTFKIPTGKNL